MNYSNYDLSSQNTTFGMAFKTTRDASNLIRRKSLKAGNTMKYIDLFESQKNNPINAYIETTGRHNKKLKAGFNIVNLKQGFFESIYSFLKRVAKEADKIRSTAEL